MLAKKQSESLELIETAGAAAPEHERMLSASIAEQVAARDGGLLIPLHLDLIAATCLVSYLQLALRHPAVQNPSAELVRSIIEAVIGRVAESGYAATAAVMRLGDNPGFDVPCRQDDGVKR
jgi:hypothetical protein